MTRKRDRGAPSVSNVLADGFRLRMRASLLILGGLLILGAEAGKKDSKKTKAAARCTACRRVVTASRAAVLHIREDLEPLRDKKIETGRGAVRVYNKRFTKTYDVELLHRVERVLEKSCAQRELMNYAQRLAKEQQELGAKEKEKSVAGGGPAKRKRGGGEGDDA